MDENIIIQESELDKRFTEKKPTSINYTNQLKEDEEVFMNQHSSNISSLCNKEDIENHTEDYKVLQNPTFSNFLVDSNECKLIVDDKIQNHKIFIKEQITLYNIKKLKEDLKDTAIKPKKNKSYSNINESVNFQRIFKGKKPSDSNKNELKEFDIQDSENKAVEIVNDKNKDGEHQFSDESDKALSDCVFNKEQISNRVNNVSKDLSKFSFMDYSQNGILIIKTREIYTSKDFYKNYTTQSLLNRKDKNEIDSLYFIMQDNSNTQMHRTFQPIDDKFVVNHNSKVNIIVTLL